MKPENEELPLGLGMALAQNTKALQHFANLSSAHQRQIIEETHGVKSKKEMHDFVAGISNTDEQ